MNLHRTQATINSSPPTPPVALPVQSDGTTPALGSTLCDDARQALHVAQVGTDDPVADDVAALTDRVAYLESALHHVLDRLGIRPHDLPDPLRPQLYAPPTGGGSFLDLFGGHPAEVPE